MTRGARTRRSSRLPLALVLVATVACKATPDRGAVQKEWNLTLRELGINPVFPPREDLQVGDLYARRGNPAAEHVLAARGFVPIDLWVASVDLRGDLTKFYGARSAFAPTVAAEAPADGAESAPISGVPRHEDGSTFEQPDVGRLRQVAFPDFMGMSVVSGDLRGLVPVEALQAAFGASWEGEHQVDVKISSAESCGLPAKALLERIVETGQDGILRLKDGVVTAQQLALLHEGIRAWVAATPHLDEEQKGELLADRSLWLDLVTEVYYARAIDIGISAKSSRGAGLEVEALGADAAEGLAASLDERLDAIGKQTLPGGSLRVLGASEQSVAMRRTYAHPIAVGYRGIQLRVDPATREVLGLSAATSGEAHTTGGGETKKLVGTKIKAAIQAWLNETRAPARFEVTFDSTSAELVFKYDQVGGEPVSGVEGLVRGNASEILRGVDWTGVEGGADNETATAFRRGQFTLIELE